MLVEEAREITPEQAAALPAPPKCKAKNPAFKTAKRLDQGILRLKVFIKSAKQQPGMK